MCGRYVHAVPFEELAAWLGGRFDPEDAERYRPRWNIAPTSTVVAMREEHGERVIGRYRWGLVPPWATELPKYPSHNARSETVAVKPTFRHAFRTQRAIVPADGYFEWQVIGSGKRAQKQPWYISPRRGPQLGFAGLYEFWRPPTAVPDDPWLASCTIVTTTPGPDVADIHDRQPVVLDRDAWDIWLDPTSDVEEVRGLLAPAPTGTFARHPVGSAVGSSRSDGPDLIAPVEPILVTS